MPPHIPVSETMHLTDLYDHFKQLYSSEPRQTNDDEIETEINDDELDVEITLEEIKNAVYSQNNNKSSGLDNLIAEVYKHSFDQISSFSKK